MIEVGRSEKIVKEMDQLASEDHTYKATNMRRFFKELWCRPTTTADFVSSFMYSAQNQFLVITQTERMVDRTGETCGSGIAEERESSSAQIRTLFNEQRRTIIAECCEIVSHHELLAAHAEEERRILQGELWRQQQDFCEVHQQDLMKMKELQKFQNSTFDEFTRQKFIEDQKIIMELSGRLQELQNEVSCMNDSKDFQDAESVRSGNSHVTSPPGLFPRHPPFEGLLKPAFISQRQTEEPPNIRDTSGISGNVFCTSTDFFVSSVSSFYFDLTFTVFFHFSFLMHPEQHTELDNLNTMQHNLRTSANKESNDAFDVHRLPHRL